MARTRSIRFGGVALVALAAAWLSAATLAAPGRSAQFTVNTDTLTRFAGRLHPVLVHFPIAMVIGALVIEFGAALRRRWREDGDEAPAVSRGALACLAIGAVGAALAAASGWAHAAADPPGSTEAYVVFLHRWLGVGAAVLAAVTLGVGLVALEGWMVIAFRVLLIAAAGLVGYGGHLGGTLVYGPGYVWSAFEKPASPPAEAGPGEPAAVPLTGLDAEVAALFDAKCIQCHGPRRQKGKLRLDRLSAVVRSEAVTPGDPDSSLIVQRVTLPLDDPDLMPAEGDPLTEAEVGLVRRWIEGLQPGTSAGGQDEDAGTPTPSAAAPDRTDRAAIQTRLDAIRAAGAAASFIAAESDLVDVNLSVLGARCTDETIGLLAGLERHLAWLNLAGTAITDAGIERLGGFVSLERLSLSGTGVGDAAVPVLAALPRLASLNLVGTRVTDAALDGIRGMPGLERLFLWRTAVTEAGVSSLRAARPDLMIQLGAAFDAGPASAVAAARPACCLTAEAAGKACDHACCIEAAGRGEVCAKCLGG